MVAVFFSLMLLCHEGAKTQSSFYYLNLAKATYNQLLQNLERKQEAILLKPQINALLRISTKPLSLVPLIL